MAGNLKTKERSIITLTSAGSSLTNGSGGSAGTDLDARSAGGTGNAEGDFLCRLELTCQWATITGISNGLVVAELHLVPKLDGTNLADVDTTAGSSKFPANTFADSFICAKSPSANTDMRFPTGVLELFPALYTAYILNKSGQTMSANWSLKVVPAQGQYT